MFGLRETPFVKLLIPFVAGILLANKLDITPWFVLPVLLALCIGLLLTFQYIYGKNYRKRFRIGIIVFFLFFTWGLLIATYYKPHVSSQNLGTLYSCIIVSDWNKTNRFYKAEAKIETKIREYRTGNVLLFHKKIARNKLPEIGDRIIFKNETHSMPSPLNPFEFDYKNYLYYNGITGTVYLDSLDYINLGKSNKYALTRFFNRWQHRLSKIISSYDISAETKSLLKALLLGDKTGLDPTIKKAFTTVGAMHVLAVSGLHVGIVLLFLYSLFRLFEPKKTSRVYRHIKSIFILLAIWCFAGVTGFSPSIVRAAAMLSFIVFGKALNRHANTYNSLAVAAFVMLFIDPYTLYSVGFQLSFLAVLGIVFFHPRLYTLFYFKNILLRKTWQLTSVSISAQIATFPIALYYFHQFPVYFLLSNLVVIPFAFIIVSAGLVLLLFSFIPALAQYIAWAIDLLVMVLNYLVIQIGNLPFHKISGVYISFFELILIYGLIISMTLYLMKKKTSFLFLFLGLGIVLSSVNFLRRYKNSHEQKITFYSIGKHTPIDIKQYNRHLFIADSNLLKHPSKIDFHISNHWVYQGLSPVKQKDVPILGSKITRVKNRVIQSDNHLFIDGIIICFNHSSHQIKNLKVFDYKVIYLNNDFKKKLDSVEYYNLILLNISKYRIKLNSQLDSLKVSFPLKVHNLPDLGALELDLASQHFIKKKHQWYNISF